MLHRSPADIRLTPVTLDDADELATLRVTAMRESLERIGRFDPERARARFLSAFTPSNTQHIELAGERVGFVVVVVSAGAGAGAGAGGGAGAGAGAGAEGVELAHLYIRPESQNQGIGAAVLRKIFAAADRLELPLRVTALRESAANRFYTNHGFVLFNQSEFDNHYQRAPEPIPT